MTSISSALYLLPLLIQVVSTASSSDSTTVTTDEKIPIAGQIPQVSLAVIALVLFGIVAVIQWSHFARMGQRFMLSLTVGTTAMALGFAIRIVLSYNPYSMGIYIIEDLLILLSPCAFFACDYLLLTRMSAHLGEDIATDCLILPARKLVKLFVFSDIATFLIQACGGGMSAIASIEKVGEKIALAGLILQLVSFFSFTVILIVFGFRVRSRYPAEWSGERKSVSEPSLFKFWRTDRISNWRILYFGVCYTCIGFLIRSTFRIVEFSQGYFGYIPTHEGFFYLLDSLPLLLAISIYIFLWPTRFVRSPILVSSPAASVSSSATFLNKNEGAKEVV